MRAVKLHALVTSVLQTMHETEANSEGTLSLYARYGFSTIERHFETIGVTDYLAAEVNNFVRAYRVEYERGAVSDHQWHLVRRSAALLETFHGTGRVNLPTLPKWGLREPTVAYGKMLEEYCAHVSRTSRMCDSTIKKRKVLSVGFCLLWKMPRYIRLTVLH